MNETFFQDYFQFRDFELVQPVYDLAFILALEAARTNGPLYRSKALFMAALNLDGYSNRVARWLEGNSLADDLEYSPSPRMLALLEASKKTGTCPELERKLSPAAQGCLRLGAVRGLGPKTIADFMEVKDSVPPRLLASSAKRSGLSESRIQDLFWGEAPRKWQAAHVLPPVFRLMRALERETDGTGRWTVFGLDQVPWAVNDGFSVAWRPPGDERGWAGIKAAVDRDPFFFGKRENSGAMTIRHRMGWTFRMESVPVPGPGKSLEELIRELDPLTGPVSGSVRSDLHTHSFWSDGRSEPEALVRSVQALGLEFVAITDHSQTLKAQNGLTPSDWLRQSRNLDQLKRAGQVLHGVEVDILAGGELDLPPGLLAKADLVTGSIHQDLSPEREVNTRRLIAAVESGVVDVIGHPTTAMIGRPGFPAFDRPRADVDWESVFRVCAQKNVALEINCFPSRLDLPPDLAEAAVEAGCRLTLGSDAHALHHLELIKFGARISQDFPGDVLLNRLPVDHLKQWIQARRSPPRPWAASSGFALEAAIAEPAGLPPGSKVMGLDLTAGNRPTGVAVIRDFFVETRSLRTDDELIELVVRERPKVVSIDSPLGLPGGGPKVDPEAGIMRTAERELAGIGIQAYPALIDSMKGLTLRGIRLKKRLERLKPKPRVLESYPGAAQDLLGIPRKQRGLGYLRSGLEKLGLKGPGLRTESHDELDAVSAALVARFFEAGLFEGLGGSERPRLIVPRIPLLRIDPPPLFLIAGPPKSGKSTVARYLAVFYGFLWLKDRKDPDAPPLASGVPLMAEVDGGNFSLSRIDDRLGPCRPVVVRMVRSSGPGKQRPASPFKINDTGTWPEFTLFNAGTLEHLRREVDFLLFSLIRMI